MPLQQVGRLALRSEGEWWNAYYALNDTMEGALLLGSIRLKAVESNGSRKDAFMFLMRGIVAEFLESKTGQPPKWNEPQTAPESERGGT